MIEDDHFNLKALGILLNQFKLNMISATDGRNGLKRLQERLDSSKPMFKLILSDFSMPEMDGPKFTKAARQLIESRLKDASR